MAHFSVGDVLVIPYFPHQDNPQNGEPRWIIIIEDLQDKVIIAPLTTQIHQKLRYNKVIEINKISSEGMKMGLTADSIIILDRTLILQKKFLQERFRKGTCSDYLIDKINNLTR